LEYLLTPWHQVCCNHCGCHCLQGAGDSRHRSAKPESADSDSLYVSRAITRKIRCPVSSYDLDELKMARKKKKSIPKLGDENLFETFGVTVEKSPSFSEVLENNLGQQDMGSILKEKAGPAKKPLSDREKLKTYPPAQEELDLHGKTGVEAERETAKFIGTMASLKHRTVRIITGKGLHSDGPAVLPDVVETKLNEMKNEKRIFDFVWEKKEKHKSGAVIVYLL